MEDADFKLLMQYFDQPTPVPDPVRFCQKVWFLICYHFCLRGRELQAFLRAEDLQVVEETGSYITLSTSFASKTSRQGGTSGSDEVSIGRIQAESQVKSVKLLLSKLDKGCPRNFQMAKKRVRADDEVWYTGQPLGKNTMASMMKRISEKASLSRYFTNHSVRATCITKLAKAGVPDSVIMATSGHRRPESLLSYNRHSEVQKKRTAAILDETFEINRAIASATPQALERLEGREASRIQTSTAVPQQPVHFAGATFSGCTINFSFIA